MEDLARLKPTFKKEGPVTAGNSSIINDGAAAVVSVSSDKAREFELWPIAKLVARAVRGVEQHPMGYGPVPAVKKLLDKTSMPLHAVSLIELNEAFATQYIACEIGLNLHRSKVNVNASGIALGHPVGCTGARITISLIGEMKRRKAN